MDDMVEEVARVSEVVKGWEAESNKRTGATLRRARAATTMGELGDVATQYEDYDGFIARAKEAREMISQLKTPMAKEPLYNVFASMTELAHMTAKQIWLAELDTNRNDVQLFALSHVNPAPPPPYEPGV